MAVRAVILTNYMAENAEYRRPSLGERIQAKLDYLFHPSGPVSKEVVRQIGKIQSAIPYGESWEAFERAKLAAPEKMSQVDDNFRDQGRWHALSKLTQLWFYAPIIVMFSGRSPATKERSKIRKSAKEWRSYLSKNPEGKRIVSAKGKVAEQRVDEIVTKIMAGQPPRVQSKV